MADVSVAAWNLHQGVDRRSANIDRTWNYVRDEIRPTVALVQEAAVLPPDATALVSPAPNELRYRTAVVGYGAVVRELPEIRTRYSKATAFTIAPRVEGTLAVGIVEAVGVEPFVAISLYGRMAPLYAQTGILRAVADIIPLFDDQRFGHRVVVGGDLNAYDQTTDRVMRRRWQAILQLIESLGLVNLAKATRDRRGALQGCVCQETDCYHITTFHHRQAAPGSPGLMADYMFATPELVERLLSFDVLDRDHPEVWEMSDHAPLVARFDML